MSEPNLAIVGPDGSIARLGRYAILENLAKGGMAQVFVAQKDGAPEVCVLKQLLLELEEHEVAGKRFHREAHVASFLNHPNIARITDAGFEDSTFCIAFEFIPGKDGETMMHKLLPEGRMLPYEVSLAFGIEVLKGLAYAHEAKDPEGNKLGLVHRDLSPRNMMLSYDGDIKIIDFGLAHGKVDDFKTAPGMVLGTLRYVSPEQALTDPIDRRSDIYSLSVVLHEMLTGRFIVQPGKPFDVLKAVVSDVPPLVTELNPHLPKGLGPVVAKGLEKDPNDRWQDAGAYLEALQDAGAELLDTPREALGEFITELFPADARRARAFVELGRARFNATRQGNPALVVPHDISDPDSDTADRTRTGFVEPTKLGLGPAHELTLIAPATLDGVDTDQYTKTALQSELRDTDTALTPTDAHMATRTAIDPADMLTTLRDGEGETLTKLIAEQTRTAVPTVLSRDDKDETYIVDRTAPAASLGMQPAILHGEPAAPIPPPSSDFKKWAVGFASFSILMLVVVMIGFATRPGSNDSEIVSRSIEAQPLEPKRLGAVAGKRTPPKPAPKPPPKPKTAPPSKAPTKAAPKPAPQKTRRAPPAAKAKTVVKPKTTNHRARVQRLVRAAINNEQNGRLDEARARAAANALKAAAATLSDKNAQKRVRTYADKAVNYRNADNLKKAMAMYMRALDKESK